MRVPFLVKTKTCLACHKTRGLGRRGRIEIRVMVTVFRKCYWIATLYLRSNKLDRLATRRLNEGEDWVQPLHARFPVLLCVELVDEALRFVGLYLPLANSVLTTSWLMKGAFLGSTSYARISSSVAALCSLV